MVPDATSLHAGILKDYPLVEFASLISNPVKGLLHKQPLVPRGFGNPKFSIEHDLLLLLEPVSVAIAWTRRRYSAR